MDYYATEENSLLKYESKTKDYDLLLHDEWKGFSVQIMYCPWCGKKLPEPLNALWCQIIKEEFGIDSCDLDAQVYATLPEEFRTDQWWKKRGL